MGSKFFWKSTRFISYFYLRYGILDYITILGYYFLLTIKIRGGGVGAYIKENTRFKQIKDYHEIDTTIENIWKEILDKENRPFLIGTLYQPGSNPRAKLPWIEKLEIILSKTITSIWRDHYLDWWHEYWCYVSQSYLQTLGSFDLY